MRDEKKRVLSCTAAFAKKVRSKLCGNRFPLTKHFYWQKIWPNVFPYYFFYFFFKKKTDVTVFVRTVHEKKTLSKNADNFDNYHKENAQATCQNVNNKSKHSCDRPHLRVTAVLKRSVYARWCCLCVYVLYGRQCWATRVRAYGVDDACVCRRSCALCSVVGVTSLESVSVALEVWAVCVANAAKSLRCVGENAIRMSEQRSVALEKHCYKPQWD